MYIYTNTLAHSKCFCYTEEMEFHKRESTRGISCSRVCTCTCNSCVRYHSKFVRM